MLSDDSKLKNQNFRVVFFSEYRDGLIMECVALGWIFLKIVNNKCEKLAHTETADVKR